MYWIQSGLYPLRPRQRHILAPLPAGSTGLLPYRALRISKQESGRLGAFSLGRDCCADWPCSQVLTASSLAETVYWRRRRGGIWLHQGRIEEQEKKGQPSGLSVQILLDSRWVWRGHLFVDPPLTIHQLSLNYPIIFFLG